MSRTNKTPSDNLAAAYLRMSADHQQYSTSNQLEVMREFASRRGLTIVKVYSDARNVDHAHDHEHGAKARRNERDGRPG